MISFDCRPAAALVSIALLAGCVGPRASEREGVSPRPECAPFRATLYFEPDSSALLPAATPILRDLADRIAVCRAAGGELTRVVVAAFPDRSARRAEARSEVAARAQTARDALVAAGLPRSAIRIRNRTDEAQLMQRRAEIEVSMW